MKNPYQVIEANIFKIIDETPNIKTFVLVPEQPLSFKTGQFMELTVPGLGEAPFTPSGDLSKGEELEFTVMKVGLVTDALHVAKVDEPLGLRGPFGNGYPLQKFEGKDVLIIGGGVGLAPLRSLLYTLLAHPSKYKRILLRYGARTPEDLLYKEELKQWQEKIDVLTTVDHGDETWAGNVGVVTTILDDPDIDIAQAAAVICGPPIMMKFVTLRLLDLGFKPESIYLSMEKNMSCGFGKCGHCRLGNFYVCKDGPVFTYEKLKGLPEIWD
ncbi:MAG: FAD/NAD(P)-binding protein [bacterium]|nr:FAD/NAD(P)-binding protein [bacterium]